MKLWEFVGKQAEITLKTGEIVVGLVTDWHDTGEVSDEFDAVSINRNIYLESEITKIKEVKK